jgi:transcriptional regulator with XRE-family HTH domain
MLPSPTKHRARSWVVFSASGEAPFKVFTAGISSVKPVKSNFTNRKWNNFIPNQEKFPTMLYFCSMTQSKIDLEAMINRAGISHRELARQLNVSHTNINRWVKDGWVSKSEYIAPLAQILGVTVDELLGLPSPRKSPIPGGKLGQAFREVSTLPQSQQQRILGTVEDMLIAQKSKS